MNQLLAGFHTSRWRPNRGEEQNQRAQFPANVKQQD